MSVQAVSWALRDAPVGGDCTSRLILVILADYAKPDGRGAYPSVQTVSQVARVSERCVRQHLKRLREDGVIRHGDQKLVSHVRADHRPTVWDLCMRPVGESGMPVTQERAISAAIPEDGVNGTAPRPLDQSQEPSDSNDSRTIPDHGVNGTAPRDPANDLNQTAPRTKPRGERAGIHGVNQRSPKPSVEPLTTSPIAPNGGGNPQHKTRRHHLPKDWQPNQAARTYATEHDIDPERSADRFRLWAEAEGKRLTDWDARYMLWLTNEKPTPPEQKPTPTPPRRTTQPHKHTAGCEHVQALLAPYEHTLDPTNTTGFGTSPRTKAAWTIADTLNQGGTNQQALKTAGLQTQPALAGNSGGKSA